MATDVQWIFDGRKARDQEPLDNGNPKVPTFSGATGKTRGLGRFS